MASPDLSQYGLTAAADGGGASFDFDASGAIESHEPGFVKALESASAQVSAAAASAIAGLDAAAEVASYVAPDVAAALTTASGEATALGVSSITGPLAPVVAAFIVAIAFVESNWATGGTGCCGERPYTEAQAVQQLRFERFGFFADEPGTSIYAEAQKWQPPADDVRRLMLYSGFGATAAPCPADHYSWDVSWGAKVGSGWNGTPDKLLLPRPAGSPEAFVEGVMRAAWEARTGCWSSLDPKGLPAILAAATRAWNNSHFATSKRVVTIAPGEEILLANPIMVAAGELRAMAKTPGAFIRLTFNTGPFIAPSLTKALRGLGSFKLAPSKPQPKGKPVQLIGGGDAGSITGSRTYDAIYAKENPGWAQAHAAQLAAEGISVPPATSAIAMKLGVAPGTPSSAPGMTIAGIPAKKLGIGALIAAGAGVASKLAGWW